MSGITRLPNPYTFGGSVYYSQNREDLILKSFFPNRKRGFYVDVGGFDPEEDSVTKLFYLEGWHGINIEPQVTRYKRFVTMRPRDINLNLGIANAPGTRRLRSYASGGLTTFSVAMQKEHEQLPTADNVVASEADVAVMPLAQVLADNQVASIQFMKIDVEGLEYEVLDSNDWSTYRPEVICIEANHVKKDWRPILRKAQYTLVFHDGLNDYYLDNHVQLTDRVEPEAFLNARGGGIQARYYKMLLDIYELAKDKIHHVDELDRSYQDVLQTIDRQQQEWQSVRIVAKRLAWLLWSRIRLGR